VETSDWDVNEPDETETLPSVRLTPSDPFAPMNTEPESQPVPETVAEHGAPYCSQVSGEVTFNVGRMMFNVEVEPADSDGTIAPAER
jgi:hypothetical protein